MHLTDVSIVLGPIYVHKEILRRLSDEHLFFDILSFDLYAEIEFLL